MGKASKKKRQQELQAESILNGKSLIARDISSKWSLFNKPIVHFFLIAIVGFLAYSNTFDVPFHFDDRGNIVGNYKLQSIQNFWPPTGSRWFGYLTFALNYYFGGLHTTSYHIVNLVIHIFNAILVYWLVVLTFKTPYFSNQQSAVGNQQSEKTNFDLPVNPSTYLPLFSALLFIAHPIQTQAVTYIVQRFTSLATMFYLLSLMMYIKFRSQQSAISSQQKLHATRYTLYAVSLISAILAMKTKEIAFTLPFVILLYEFSFLSKLPSKIAELKKLLPLAVILLTLLIIPLSLIGIDKPLGDAIGELRETSQEGEEIQRWSYLFTQFSVIVTYIRLLFLPINQNLDYDYPLYHSFFNPEVFLSFLFLLSICWLGVYLFYRSRHNLTSPPFANPPSPPFDKVGTTRNRGGMGGFPNFRLISFGIFWFFITLSVESSIIPIRDVIFEHRLYLPSIGIIIIFVSAVFYILQTMIQNPKRSLAACCLLLATAVIVLSIAAYRRNIVWQDEVSLWEDAAKKSPEKVRVYYNLGKIYSDKGCPDKAIENYQIALRVKPDFIEAHNNLGAEYNEIGWSDKAIEHYQIAISLGPDFIEAHNNIGNAYVAKGWIDKAIEHYWFALRLKPNFTEAHNNLGVAYERKGLIKEAIKEYQIALMIDPGFKAARDNLNKLLRLKGK